MNDYFSDGIDNIPRVIRKYKKGAYYMCKWNGKEFPVKCQGPSHLGKIQVMSSVAFVDLVSGNIFDVYDLTDCYYSMREISKEDAFLQVL